MTWTLQQNVFECQCLWNFDDSSVKLDVFFRKCCFSKHTLSMQHAACFLCGAISLLITNDSNIAVARLESSPFWLPRNTQGVWNGWFGALIPLLVARWSPSAVGQAELTCLCFLFVCCLFFAWYLWIDEKYIYIYTNIVENAIFYSKLIKVSIYKLYPFTQLFALFMCAFCVSFFFNVA